MKLNELFESTGDKKFDSMMGSIVNNFRKIKVNDPDGEQDILNTVSSELTRIWSTPDKLLKPYAKELKPISKDYPNNASILEILFFHASDKSPNAKPGFHEDDLEDLANAFIVRHKNDIKMAMEEWINAFRDLERKIDLRISALKNNNIDISNLKKWKSISNYAASYNHAQTIVKSLEHNLNSSK
jgi:hypothetical protein